MQSAKLLKRLEDAHLKEHRCERCGITEWQGGYISLHLHHKDGNHSNNQLENLEVLCPNCHSQTDNFAGKNAKRDTKKKVKIKYSPIKEKSNNSNYNSDPLKKGLCIICNKQIYYEEKPLCRNCNRREERRNNPDYNITQVVDYYEKEHKRFKEIAEIFNLSVNIIINDYCKYKGINSIKDLIGREKLKQMIRQYTFLHLSAEFGVSDKAIVKWCISFNLPYKKKDINSYTDEEWKKI